MTIVSRLSGREKALLLGVLPLIALFAGYRFGWVPVNDMRRTAEAQIASYRSVIEAAETIGKAPPQPQMIDVPSEPLANRITRSAEDAGVLVRRLEPEGDLVRVTLDDALFDDVVTWIAAMATQEMISLLSLEMDRRTAPGVVSARLTLETTR